MIVAISRTRPRQVLASAPIVWQRPFDVWIGLALFILFGYSFLGKWFAFIAIPLGVPLLLNANIVLTPWCQGLTRSSPLGGVSWALLLSLMCGVWESVRGFLFGYDPYPVLQIFLFNLTPLYLFVGVWLGACRPRLLQQWVRVVAWGGALYPFLYYLALNKVHIALGNPDLFSLPDQARGH